MAEQTGGVEYRPFRSFSLVFQAHPPAAPAEGSDNPLLTFAAGQQFADKLLLFHRVGRAVGKDDQIG